MAKAVTTYKDFVERAEANALRYPYTFDVTKHLEETNFCNVSVVIPENNMFEVTTEGLPFVMIYTENSHYYYASSMTYIPTQVLHQQSGTCYFAEDRVVIYNPPVGQYQITVVEQAPNDTSRVVIAKKMSELPPITVQGLFVSNPAVSLFLNIQDELRIVMKNEETSVTLSMKQSMIWTNFSSICDVPNYKKQYEVFYEWLCNGTLVQQSPSTMVRLYDHMDAADFKIGDFEVVDSSAQGTVSLRITGMNRMYEMCAWLFTDLQSGKQWSDEVIFHREYSGKYRVSCEHVLPSNATIQYQLVYEKNNTIVHSGTISTKEYAANPLLEKNYGTITLNGVGKNISLELNLDYSCKWFETVSTLVFESTDDWGNDNSSYEYTVNVYPGTYTISDLSNDHCTAKLQIITRDMEYDATLSVDNNKYIVEMDQYKFGSEKEQNKV